MSGKLLDGELLGLLDTMDLYVRRMKRGNYSGARRSRAYGSSPEFADYREYVPGDDLRRIDWNLAGRFERFYIKRFIDEKQGRNRVYIDQSASMGLPAEKGEMTLKLAAVLGYLSVSNMDCVAFKLLSGDKCVPLGGNVIGRESFYAALKSLEQVAFAGATDIGAALRDDPSPGFDDGMTYIISDFLTDSDWKGAVDALLGRGREVALIQVLSPQELDPQFQGTQCFCDAEQTGRGARVHVDVNRDALRAYRQALDFWMNDIRHFCASRGVAMMTVGSNERMEDVLLKKGCVEELVR